MSRKLSLLPYHLAGLSLKVFRYVPCGLIPKGVLAANHLKFPLSSSCNNSSCWVSPCYLKTSFIVDYALYAPCSKPYMMDIYIYVQQYLPVSWTIRLYPVINYDSILKIRSHAIPFPIYWNTKAYWSCYDLFMLIYTVYLGASSLPPAPSSIDAGACLAENLSLFASRWLEILISALHR